jgi:hypothetical protein
LTDIQVMEYLRENGYPEHVVREGRPGLLRRWREFVEQVENGYPLGLENYRNDLDVRGILSFIDEATPELAELDSRLKKLLKPSRARVWESAPGDPFWDWGYPGNAGPDLLQDLRDEDLLDS